MMSRVKRGIFQPHFSSKTESSSALRLMKWLVLIALLVLILLALFLPDRGLAAHDGRRLQYEELSTAGPSWSGSIPRLSSLR
jgi:hypothetical protein